MGFPIKLQLTPLAGTRFALEGLERWSGGWVRLRVRVRVPGSGTIWPRLLFDFGEGFSELRALVLPACSAARPEIDHVMHLQQGVRAVQLAPASRAMPLAVDAVHVTPLSKYESSLRRLAAVAAADGLAACVPHAARELKTLLVRPERDPLQERYRELQLGRGGAYADWVAAFEPAAESCAALGARWQGSAGPRISVVLPVHDTPAQLLEEAVASVRAQAYPHWELCIADDASSAPHLRGQLAQYRDAEPRVRLVRREANGGIAAATNSALALASGDYVAFLDHDDRLHPLALHFVAEAAAANPDAGLLYSDEDKIDATGARRDPYFKCAFNYELLLGQNMFNHLSVYRRALLEALGGLRPGFEGAQDYDLALRAVEALQPAQIVHIPRVLYHWRATPGSAALGPEEKPQAAAAARRAVQAHLERRGIRAEVSPAPEAPAMNRVRPALPEPPPRVSIVIPTRDAGPLLQACLGSIERRSTYRDYDVTVVYNGEGDGPAESGRVRVIRQHAPFNYSALNNLAVRQAEGEFVCLLNDDIEILAPDWIEEMLSFAALQGVGAVGARLWYPDGRLQHGGVILGLRSAADHAHRYLRRGQPGYFCRAVLHQSLSAVTAACLMVRKSTYLAVGGLDEAMPVAFNDIDFCLRLRQAGHRTVWTPYAEMIHHESATRGRDATPQQVERANAEVRFMERRWGALLLDDPAYSPNLTLETEDFSPAWPPRAA